MLDIAQGYADAPIARRSRSAAQSRRRPRLARVRRRAPRRRAGRRRSSAARGRAAPSRAAACSCRATRATSGVTVHALGAIEDDEVGRRALDEPGRRPAAIRPPSTRRRPGRQRLDRPQQRQPAGVDRGEQDAERGLEPADPVGRQPELDRLVDLGVRRVVGRDRVGRAVQRAPPGRPPRRRRARSGGLTRSDVSYGAADERAVRPRVAARASQAQRRAPATHSSVKREVVRRHVAGDRQARAPWPAGRGRARPPVERWVRWSRAPGTSRHDVGQDREVARDRASPRRRPASRAARARSPRTRRSPRRRRSATASSACSTIGSPSAPA